MSYYWISWVQPGNDVRPLHYPPGERVLGWWSTGYAQGGQTLCAMVRAVSEAQAKDAVLDDWPEAGEWRFCDPRKTPEVTDRFPLKEWMVERLRSQKLADAGFHRRPSLWAMEAMQALELIATPMRPDGTWNRDRAACRQIAAEALGRHDEEKL